MDSNENVNVLMVDDQPAKLLSYEVILQGLGANLIKATSARQALERLLKHEVAVVLIDVSMPELDGFELAKMLREHPRYEKTAIIFVSAIHLSDVDHVRGYETGAVDYVSVPVIPEILRAKVRIFVDLYRKTRQLESLNDELERRVAERTAELEASTMQLRESEERLRLASEAAGFGTYDYKLPGGEVYWSRSLRRIAGVEGEQLLTFEKVLGVIHPDDRDVVAQHVQGFSSAADRRTLEFRIVRPDGGVRWLLDRGQAMPDGRSARNAWRIIGTALDITERKQAEERQRLLMAELDHRVKNTLSNVSAVAHLSSHRAASVGSFVQALDGRIQAMSQAHALLARGAWAGTDLRELVTEVLTPFLTRAKDNIRIDGEPAWVLPELTQSLALTLHELATNALKHGALSTPAGHVRISWTIDTAAPRPQLQLAWREEAGPAVSQPTTQGFGLTVLKAAASDVGALAECRFDRTGFEYALKGPFVMPHNIRPAIPRQPHTADAAGPSPAERARPSRSRILVIEDEALVALQLQADLESVGHTVVGPARSLQAGLSLAKDETIDLALVDVSLGRETSAPIADELLARKVPFAFVTGYSDTAVLPEHLRKMPRLSKPYVLADVRRIIARLLDDQPGLCRSVSAN
ncbi:MAG TPA: response regulator [Hyphomicrobiaceae bacterium]|jgi:PAS domain S-box-containing protein|nr:response regulator [Hyphomicrobiaceae bacterium]